MYEKVIALEELFIALLFVAFFYEIVLVNKASFNRKKIDLRVILNHKFTL